jgi:hypothetical protein
MNSGKTADPPEGKSTAPDEPIIDDGELDESLVETFPASDPPSWTLGHERRKREERDDNDDDSFP